MTGLETDRIKYFESCVVSVVSAYAKGSALYLGSDGEKQYFLTALHVLQEEHPLVPSEQRETDSSPRVYVDHSSPKKASLSKLSFTDFDLAILKVEEEAGRLTPVVLASNGLEIRSKRPISPVLACASRSHFVELQSIDGDVQSGGEVGPYLQLGGSALRGGFSGGGLFQEDKKGWVCAGLTLKGGPGAATSVYLKSQAIIKLLRDENIPFSARGLSWTRGPLFAVAALIMAALTVLLLISIRERSRAYEACRQLKKAEGGDQFTDLFHQYYDQKIGFIRRIVDDQQVGNAEDQELLVDVACASISSEFRK